MPTVSLSSVGTDNVNTASATPINNNFTTIQSAINALDNQNVAGGAAIAYAKLALSGSIVNADVSPSAALDPAKISGYPTDNTKFLRGDGTWAAPPTTGLQKVTYVGYPVLGSLGNTAWETASAAILVPFTLQVAQSITTILFKAAGTLSGNYDVGVYDNTGTRKVSKGSTAQSGLTASAVNAITVSTTALAAGQYWLALAADNTTGTFQMASTTAEILGKYALKVTSSFPLPASLTLGSTVPTNVPVLAGTVT